MYIGGWHVYWGLACILVAGMYNIHENCLFNQNVQIHGPGHVFGPKRGIHVFYMYVFHDIHT